MGNGDGVSGVEGEGDGGNVQIQNAKLKIKNSPTPQSPITNYPSLITQLNYRQTRFFLDVI